MSRRTCAVMLAAMLLADSSLSMAQANSVDVDGIRVNWEYRPLSSAASDAGLGTLEIQLEDSTRHQALRYRRGQLAAWLRPERHALSDSELSCADQVRAFSRQKVAGKSEIDLNGWRLLSFNSDRTLAFINPYIAINNAKLESIVSLPGDIDNWTALPGRFQVWVHTRGPDQSHLSLVDTQRRAITASQGMPKGPAAMVADADDRGLWIIAPETQQIGRLDSERPDQTPRWTGAPAVVGAIPAQTGRIYAWHNDVVPSVRLWQAEASGEPASARLWTLPAPILTARWSKQGQRLIVALADGRIAWIDPQSPRSQTERILSVGSDIHLSAMELFDEGRRLLWLDGTAGKAGAMDIATGRSLAATAVTTDADTIAVTADFAYFHSTRGAHATLLSLADLRSGRAQPVEVSTGRTAPDAVPGLRVVPEPDGRGVLVANPSDGVIYQYAEGMMAPAGSFSNYRRSALGLMVLDNALSETAPGHYRASVRNQQAGRHSLILGGLNPRLAACIALDLPGPTQQASAPPSSAAKAKLESLTALPERPLSKEIQVRLVQGSEGDAKQLAGVKDLTLLVFERRTAWQQRARMQETVPGLYAAQVTLPHPGKFDWLVSSPSQGLAFHTPAQSKRMEKP